MKFVSALAIFFISLAMTLLPSTPAYAATVTECQTAINETQASTNAATTLASKSVASLNGKLTDASTKLEEGKFEDTLIKLIDFRTSVEQLASAPKPKIGSGDATLLLAEVNDAINCVQGLVEEPN